MNAPERAGKNLFSCLTALISFSELLSSTRPGRPLETRKHARQMETYRRITLGFYGLTCDVVRVFESDYFTEDTRKRLFQRFLYRRPSVYNTDFEVGFDVRRDKIETRV